MAASSGGRVESAARKGGQTGRRSPRPGLTTPGLARSHPRGARAEIGGQPSRVERIRTPVVTQPWKWAMARVRVQPWKRWVKHVRSSRVGGLSWL